MKRFLETKPAAAGLILLLELIWAFSYIIIKVTVQGGTIPPMSLAFLRFATAYAALCCIRIPGPLPTRKDQAVIALMGLLGMALYFAFENYGLVYTSATNASILVSLIPAFTALGAAFFFKAKFTFFNVAGLAAAFTASALVVWNGKVRFNLNPLGDILILLSVIVWTAYTLVGRSVMMRYPAARVARASLLTAMVCTAPFFVLELSRGELAGITPMAGLGVLYLGILCTALAFTIWSHCVRVLGVVYTSNLLYLQSVITMICAWATIREPITLFLVMCTLGLIAGVYLSNLSSRGKAGGAQ